MRILALLALLALTGAAGTTNSTTLSSMYNVHFGVERFEADLLRAALHASNFGGLKTPHALHGCCRAQRTIKDCIEHLVFYPDPRCPIVSSLAPAALLLLTHDMLGRVADLRFVESCHDASPWQWVLHDCAADPAACTRWPVHVCTFEELQPWL